MTNSGRGGVPRPADSQNARQPPEKRTEPSAPYLDTTPAVSIVSGSFSPSVDWGSLDSGRTPKVPMTPGRGSASHAHNLRQDRPSCPGGPAGGCRRQRAGGGPRLADGRVLDMVSDRERLRVPSCGPGTSTSMQMDRRKGVPGAVESRGAALSASTPRRRLRRLGRCRGSTHRAPRGPRCTPARARRTAAGKARTTSSETPCPRA